MCREAILLATWSPKDAAILSPAYRDPVDSSTAAYSPALKHLQGISFLIPQQVDSVNKEGNVWQVVRLLSLNKFYGCFMGNQKLSFRSRSHHSLGGEL